VTKRGLEFVEKGRNDRRIGILGTGDVGQTLGTGFAKLGHE
jgi:hypothetical protein